MIIDEWIIREVIDTLYMAKSTLLGITGLDTPQEVEKKCREKESAITRRIDKSIDIIQQTADGQSLTWQEVKRLCDCFMDVGLSSDKPARSKAFYEEVLERYNSTMK